MSIYRRHKKNNYTCIDNHVFMNHSLSMKAKGLLTQIYSLPDDWEYSVKGLASLFSDGETAVNSALQELIDYGYIIRSQKINQLGRFDGYEYDIYETPHIENENNSISEEPFSENPFSENPVTDNPVTEDPVTENLGQLNTNISNTNIPSTNILNTKGLYIEDKPQKKKFIPPTVDEVAAYCQERNNGIDAEEFVDWYQSRNWMSGKTKLSDWKACVRTWEKKKKNSNYSKPSSGNPFIDLLKEEGYT